MNALTSLQVHEKTLASARSEQTATLHLLECLHEVDVRRVFADRGYSSLFDYVHRGLGYSESQASERIRAMRLAFAIPEVKHQLETGELNLTTTARIASHAKRESLAQNEIIALANQAAHKSAREVDQLLVAQASDPTPYEKVRAISPNITELKIAVSAEFMALLQEAQELEPTPGTSLTEMLEIALRTHLAHKRKSRAKASTELRLPQSSLPVGEIHPRVLQPRDQDGSSCPKPRSRHVPRPTQRSLWEQSGGQCEFTDPETQTRCTSRQAIQIEHVKPYAKGGTHAPTNLKHYCATHNRVTAEREFGRWGA